MCLHALCSFFFFFNDTATTEIYTLSLHDALPIWNAGRHDLAADLSYRNKNASALFLPAFFIDTNVNVWSFVPDRKSTRLNSSHGYISYAVFCLKKKKTKKKIVVIRCRLTHRANTR